MELEPNLCPLGFGSLALSKLYFLFCKNGILISRADNAELRIKWASTCKSTLQMLVVTGSVSAQPELRQIRALFSSSPTSWFQSASRLPAKKFWKGCDHCGQEGDCNEWMKHQVKARSNLITSSSSSSSPQVLSRFSGQWEGPQRKAG